MTSLRFRLLLASVLVAIVVLGVIGLLARRTVAREFALLQLHQHGDPARLRTPADALRERWIQDGDWRGASAVLQARRPAPAHLLLTDPAGRIAGASAPELARARVVLDRGEALTLELAGDGGIRRIEYDGVPGLEIRSPAGRAIGRLRQIDLPEDGALRERARMQRAINAGIVLALGLGGALAIVLLLTLGGTVLRPVEALTAAAQRMERGDLDVRVAVRSRDEIGRLAQAFNAMAETLARQESLRRQLVTDVAHELRTPLTHLRCQIEGLEDGLVTPDAAALRSLHEETLLLARLVDDLQDLALAEAGRLSLELAPLDPGALIATALQAVRAAAEEAGVTLIGEAPALPPVLADRERVAQTLRNLLSNAIRHTPRGGRIEVSAARAHEHIAFVVRDTGCGIPADQLPLVFERFHRVDPARARATGGAGLGLAIVRRLVEAQGGEVSVASREGEGAAFRFTLPAAVRPAG